MRFGTAVAVAMVVLGGALASAQTMPAGTQAQGGTFGDTCRYDAHKPSVVLTGKVTDETGAVLVGARVGLECGAFRQVARTVGDGTYRLAIAAGSYQIDVDMPGFEPWAETIDLRAPGPQHRNFALSVGRLNSIVSVTAPGGFVATSSTTATKTDAPLIEIPQSVSVITEAQMSSRNVQTVDEAIQYTSSVGVDTYGSETRFDWINIRGFDQSTYGLYRDDSRWQSGQVSGEVDPYLIQEVDIVKGPSSVLYGQNAPGGLVNLVTKRPPLEPLHEIVLNYGSFDRKQVQADFGGPIDKAGHWRYRLTGLYRKSNTQVDYVPDDRWFVAPALTWAPSDKTTLTLLADYQHDNSGWSQFLPSQGTFLPNPNGRIPTSRFTGEPGYDYFHRNQWSVGSLFEQQFSKNVTLRNTLRYSSIKYDGQDVFGGGLQSDMRTLNRYGFGNALDLRMLTTDTNLYIRARTGIVEHSVLLGTDYSNSESTIVSGFASAPSLDIFAPVYGAKIPALFTYYNTSQPVSLLGVYAQDHMKIAQRTIVTAAGREDWTDLSTHDRIGGSDVKQSPNKFTGRIGLMYLTNGGFAPYISYSTSFLPVAGVNFYGKPFLPTSGTQIEGGVKYQPKDSNSFLTASLYQITQGNVSVPDPTNPLNTLQQGKIRSRGIELEAVSNLAPGVDLHGSYSYLDQKVTETTNPDELGKRPPLAPNHLLSVMGSYTLTSGPMTGLGLNLGVRYVGTRAGDSINSIIVPSYTLVDASVRYLWKDTEFLLSANNLLNKTYVAVCTSPSYCNYGYVRRLIFSVRYGW